MRVTLGDANTAPCMHSTRRSSRTPASLNPLFTKQLFVKRTYDSKIAQGIIALFILLNFVMSAAQAEVNPVRPATCK